VNVEYERLSQWMITNKKVHYSLEDAYLLANKDAIFKRERTKAAEAALKKATDKTVGSIGKGDPNSKTTGFDNYLSMSEDDLTKKIDGFTDAEATKFFKEAPKALKDKFPSLPW
jgi:ABC-type molybdate transport system substrate-binding protein